MLVAAEVRFDVVLAPLLIGAALFGVVLVCTSDGRTRIAFAWAIGSSVLLAFGATLMSLCTLEANPSLYVERCASRSYDWPLLGIPVLLALALFGRPLRGLTLWLAGAAVFLTALAIPFFWLTTAR
ncbi:MAG TPA: hypothetical protein VNP96_09645 [Solirubrobacterales bacterium]|nr:hypothetical protein [Solirubrobacterales bacterium]